MGAFVLNTKSYFLLLKTLIFAHMNIKKHIPNLFTLTNLLSGCILVYVTALRITPDKWLQDESLMNWFLLLVGISLVADFLDGLVARRLNVASPLGLQLDSLADMVTFGVFPGLLMVKLLQMSLGTTQSLIPFIGFTVTLFSALRLAKFNVDTTQVTFFKGLATPANAILILGIYISSQNFPEFFQTNGFNLFLATSIISSFLLVSNIPMFSFKLNSLEWKKHLPQLILIILVLLFLVLFQWSGLALIIITYIILSLIFRKLFVHA